MEVGPDELDAVTSERGQEPLPSRDEHTSKFGLPFILAPPETLVAAPLGSASSTCSATSSGSAKKGAVQLSKEEKKLRRTCRHEGCRNYIVHKGLCCRHGGGKKCSHEGCNTSAKHRGLCWKHGGSVKCKEDGCNKKAKARGLCWAHGGGTKCRNADCSKVAVSSGFCWAHGGGKRCGINGCIKPAYERTHNLCEAHFVHLRHANYLEV